MISAATRRAKARGLRIPVEIEVTTLAEFREALAAGPDMILLDNWSVANIRKAIRLMRSPMSHVPCPVPLLEASGGVTLENVRQIAATGVDRISIGRLTHSAPSLDLSLEVL
jgi:nicotinate-nucleotide pyrophosphorylase (carboxylating)